MDRQRLSPWILVSAALAMALLLCVSDLLTLPYTRKPLVPSILTPIANLADLGSETRSVLGNLLVWPVPLAILVANLTILIVSQERHWHPRWLAWIAFAFPAALVASLLVAVAASLQFFTSIIPLGLAGAVLSLVMLGVARRRDWRPLWPWWVTLLFSASYVFVVVLSLALRHFGVVRPLL